MWGIVWIVLVRSKCFFLYFCCGVYGLIRPVVVVVDVVNDFVSGVFGGERVGSIIAPLQCLVAAAHCLRVPVVFCNDAHYRHDVEVVRKWGCHAMQGTFGAKIVDEVVPDLSSDFVVETHTYSGFYESGLDLLLRGLYDGLGAKTVVLCGLQTHICVRHTAADAFFRGYYIVIACDGTEANTEQQHRRGLKYMENMYNAEILTVDEIIKKITCN